MHRHLKRVLLVGIGLVSVAAWPVRAQIVVHDPAVTFRNSVTATIEQYLFNIQNEQRRQIRRMSRRLSLFTDLDKYVLMDTPEWRIHEFQDAEAVLFARDYHTARN